MSEDGMSVEEEEVITNLTNSDVVTKYKTAAQIANRTLEGLVAYSTIGKNVLEICMFGDTLVKQQCSQIFKSKKVEKGLAFPTSVSVNECVCHYSPLASETNVPILKDGDVVKFDVGVHIDGYITVVAHTIVVQATPGPVTGKAADVLLAGYTAAQAALRLVKAGNTNASVTDAMKQVSEDFQVNRCQGVLMHQMKRFVIDGNQVIIGREEIEQKVDQFEFEPAQVYTIDVVMTSGEGKPIEREARTTIFKRAVDQTYMLRMKASRYVFNEINKKYPTLPFTTREFGDEKQARMGVVECVKHDLITPYPVLFEKAGDVVAHFKYTVLLLSSGTCQVTGLPIDLSQFQSDKTISDEIKALVETPMVTASKKKKKKKKGKKPAGGEEATAMDTEKE